MIFPQSNLIQNVIQKRRIKPCFTRKTNELHRLSIQKQKMSKLISRFSHDYKSEEKNKKINTNQPIWHKKSVSMKMKSFNFIQNRKSIKGFLVKFRKEKQIYSFRCFKVPDERSPQIDLTGDNDIQTDDEQIYLAQRNLFYNLCGSIQNEIMQEAEEENKSSDETLPNEIGFK